MALLLERPWRRQPIGAVSLDRTNPLARGVAFVYLPSFRESNLVTGTLPTRIGTPKTHVIGGAIALDVAGAANLLDWGTPPLALDGVPYAVGVVGLATNTTDAGVVFSMRSGLISHEIGTYLDALQNHGHYDDGVAAGTKISLAAGIPFVAVSNASGYLPGNLYVNGALASTAADTWAVPDADSLRIGHRSGSGVYWPGSASLLVIWNRYVVEGEARAFCANPWQLFAPRRILVPAATGIPVLSAATVTSITSTTATPRVTVTF